MNNDTTFEESLELLQKEVKDLSKQADLTFNKHINPLWAKFKEYKTLLDDRQKNKVVPFNNQQENDYHAILNILESEKIRYLHERISFFMKDNKPEDITYFKKLKIIKKELQKLLYARRKIVVNNGHEEVFCNFFKKLQDGFYLLESRFDSEKYSINNIKTKIKDKMHSSSIPSGIKSKSLGYLLFMQIKMEQEIDRFFKPIQDANKINRYKYQNEAKKIFHGFIINSIIPFIDHDIDKMISWYKEMPEDKRVSIATIMEVRTKIMALAGIEEIQIKEGNTTFDRRLHIESAKEVKKQYPRNVIIKIIEKGYSKVDTNEIIQKARVIVNYR